MKKDANTQTLYSQVLRTVLQKKISDFALFKTTSL